MSISFLCCVVKFLAIEADGADSIDKDKEGIVGTLVQCCGGEYSFLLNFTLT